MPEPLVNQSGTIENLNHQGFTLVGAFGELIDNSTDYGGKHLHIGMIKNTVNGGGRCYIADDGAGMTKDKLSQSCLVNNPCDKDDFGSRSGRFGVGGSAALNVISGKSGSIHKITRSHECTDLLAIEVNYETDKTCPASHHASRNQEAIWDDFSIERSGTGTVIIADLDEEKYLKVLRLVEDNTTNGLAFSVSTRYHRKIETGLTVNINGRIIHPFNSSASSSAVYAHQIARTRDDILILRHKMTDETEFAIRYDPDDTTAYSLPPKKLAVNMKLIQLPLESYVILGSVISDLAYSPNWDNIHKEINQTTQFDMGDNISGETIARLYIRNGSVIQSFPTPTRKQGDKASYKYYNNVIQQITTEPNRISDAQIGIQLNKSQLIEKNVNPKLKNLLDYLSKKFSDTEWKKSPEYAESQDKKKKKDNKTDDASSIASDDASDDTDIDSVDTLIVDDDDLRSLHYRAPPAAAAAVYPQKLKKLNFRTKCQPFNVIVAPEPAQEEPAQEEPAQEPAQEEPAQEPAQEPAPPVISIVPSYTSRRILWSVGKAYITKLYEEHPNSEIENCMDDILRENQKGTTRENADLWLMFYQTADKYRMLLHIIDSHYSGDFMCGGSKLYDLYRQYYPE